MKTAILAFTAMLLLPAIVARSAWCDAPRPARPGSINYVEGQAMIGSETLSAASVGAVELGKDQTLTTRAGKVEILLTPGVFLRVADNSSVRMVSPELANTEVSLDKGRALIEAIELRKENKIRVIQPGASVRILKRGLYDFDADHGQVRVFKGEAEVRAGDQEVKLKDRHMAAIAAGSPVKGQGLKAGYTKTNSIAGLYCAPDICRKPPLMPPALMLARDQVGTGRVGWAGAGIGIRGSTPTLFFQRMECFGVPSGGDFTRRLSYIVLPTFIVPTIHTHLGSSMALTAMALPCRGEDYGAD